jgi:transposase
MPPMRTLPTPHNCSLQELETSIRCAPTRRSHARLLAIKALFLGIAFETVCELHKIHPRSLQRWVRAFNRQGIDGVIEKARSGRPRKISEKKAPEIIDLLVHPEKAGHNHWTGRKIHGYLRKNLEVEVGYSTLMRFFHEQGFRLKVPQPWPDRQDEQAREAFCQRLKQLLAEADLDLWFGDETGVEGDPRPRRRWIEVGRTGRVTKNGDHLRMNVCGLVCPRTGEAFFCEFSHSDTEIFQAFLDEANRCVSFQRQRAVLVLDNASWHKAKRLQWGRF